ncbi:MAG: 3'-5' exonuclease domain-containing protein 2 [Dysgonamonadaceae bacterium]|nr:3'-5' exonuclease domain-containing protein 2 [Dysgonamonadaceae bacterium]
MDREAFEGQIIEIQSAADVKACVEYLSRFEIIGFDTETRPSFQKGKRNVIALIQLAVEDRCFLFRLNKIGFPAALIRLLSNPHPLKIGLSLRDDFSSMARKKRFTPHGFIDLQKLAREHGIEEQSLQKIYAILFQKKITKNQRLSNWEAEALTLPQKHYAALDAWACLKIYEKLCPTKKCI